MSDHTYDEEIEDYLDLVRKHLWALCASREIAMLKDKRIAELEKEIEELKEESREGNDDGTLSKRNER